MKEYALSFCIIVENNICLFPAELGIGVSDIWSNPVPHEQRQNSTMSKSLNRKQNHPILLDTTTTSMFLYQHDRHIL